MTRSISLSPEQRQALLGRYRQDPEPEVRFRSHILLLLDDGHSWVTVASLLFCSSRTIDRWVKRFHSEGREGLGGHKPGRPFRLAAADWVAVVVEWVTEKAPRDFGFLRSRWSCGTLAQLIRDSKGVAVGRETVRRWLHEGGLVYRRPGPWSARPTSSGRRSSTPCGGSWPTCPTTRRRSSRTRWTSTRT